MKVQKLKIELPYNTIISLWGTELDKTIIRKDTHNPHPTPRPVFIAALFIITKKQPKVSIDR